MRRVLQSSFAQDACEHGKRRDAHRRAHEERELVEAHVGRGEPRVEIQRQQHAEQHRQRDAGVAGQHRGVSEVSQALEIELEPDEKHEQQQAELTEGVQVRVVAGREHGLRDRGRQPAEERGAEGDAHRHLADDLRLAEPAGSDASNPGTGDQHRHREQEQRETGVAARDGSAKRARGCGRRRLQPGAHLQSTEHADHWDTDQPDVLHHHARNLVHDQPLRGLITTRYTPQGLPKLFKNRSGKVPSRCEGVPHFPEPAAPASGTSSVQCETDATRLAPREWNHAEHA